jgi:hypothetical protein
MAKTATLNKHQKAARRPGERRVSRGQVAELIRLAASDDAAERLTAATYLCPCHVRGRTDEIWDVVTRLMTDEAPKVRFAAWHTLEDGGLPVEPGVLARLRTLYDTETDETVRVVARSGLGKALAEEDRRELARLRAPPVRETGKCDFCGDRGVAVTRDYDTMIPTGAMSRAALRCGRCA